MQNQTTQTATISIDAGHEIWRIPNGLRGFNFWGTRSDKAFFPEYRKIGLGMLRFPPGRTGDENELGAQLMDDSGTVANALGADLIVEVRLRSGTPERAAEDVRFMNIKRGYKARYWEVGNEPDIYGRRAGEPDFSPTWYAERFRAYVTAMKAIDPTILICGPVLSNKLNEWMPPFIHACGDIIDGLSWHFYGGDGQQSEENLLNSTAAFDQQVAMVRKWWADPNGNPLGHGRTVPLIITEYGASYQTNLPHNLTTLAAALWTADMFGHLVANKIDQAAYFALWGLENHGVWDRLGKPRPVYHTFRMLNEFGDRVIQATSNQPDLAAYASIRPDGALSLLAINKSSTNSYQAILDLQGFQPNAPPTLLRQADGIAGEPVPYQGSVAPVKLDLPPRSTTVAILTGSTNRIPTEIIAGGVTALVGAALFAGAARVIRRRRAGGQAEG